MRRPLLGRGWRLSGSLVVPLLLPLVAGCGAGTGTVTGEVIYQNKPLRGGWVTFVPDDPKTNAVRAKIDENGHYELTLPAGAVRISVDNRELKPQSASGTGLPPVLPPGFKLAPGLKASPPKGGAQRPPGEYREIPSRYYQVEKSGLTYTVTAGAQKKDIELK